MPPISLRDSTTGNTAAIAMKAPNHPHRTLGVMQSPDLSSDGEFDRLFRLVAEENRKLIPFRLSASDSLTYLHCILRPKLSYSGTVTNLSRRQWQRIQRPIQITLLNNYGFPRCFPLAAVFGPISSGGLGFVDGFTEQGLLHVQALLHHIRANTELGTMLLVTLSWAQKYSGYSTSLLSDPSLPIEHVPSPWFATALHYLEIHDCHLVVDHPGVTLLQRLHDRALMDETRTLPPGQRKAINRCRLFLKVTSLADLCDETGTFLQPSLFRGEAKLPSSPVGLWPHQPRPGPSSWAVFRKFLRAFCSSTGKLHTPLGKWFPRGPTRTWHTVYDRATARIYQQTSANAFRRLVFTGILPRDEYLVWDNNCLEVSDSLLPPKGSLQVRQLACPASGKHFWTRPAWLPTRPLPPPVTTTFFHSHVSSMQAWQRMLLRDLSYIASRDTITSAFLTSPVLFLATDGSAKLTESIGTFGWALATQDTILATGFGPVHGAPMSSARSEAVGLLAGIQATEALAQCLEIPNPPKIQSYLDNEGVVKTVTGFHSTPPTLAFCRLPNSDVYAELWHTMTTATCKPRVNWVRGHQDRNVHLRRPLTRGEELNIVADDLATRGRLHYMSNPIPQFFPFPRSRITLYHLGQPRTSHTTHLLREYNNTRRFRTYLLRRLDWTLAYYNTFDHETYGTMRRGVGPALLRFTTRHLIDWLPTKSLQAHYDPAIRPTCPFCASPETTQHIWVCPARHEWRLQFQQQLKDHLASARTCPAITQPLLQSVADYFEGTAGSTVDVPAFLKGLLPSSWRVLQSEYHHECNTKYAPIPDGPAWSRRLVAFVWAATNRGWRQRCDEAASLEVTTQHEMARSSIARLYAKATVLPRSLLSEILPESQAVILQRSLENQQSWLAVTSPAVDAAVYRHQQLQRTRTRPLTYYFPYTNTTHGLELVATPVAARHAGSSCS